MSSHPPRHELEGYVMGTLDPERCTALEAHVAGCTTCAAALSSEARVEVALHAAAQSPAVATRPRARSVRRAATLTAAAALAAAAAAHLISKQTSSRRATPSPERTIAAVRVVCDAVDDEDARRCRLAARCGGLVVEAAGPPDVPTYEAALTECARAPGLALADDAADRSILHRSRRSP
jgi:hypothetical protein